MQAPCTRGWVGFLYIDPLKQGLKLTQGDVTMNELDMFLYIDPLKQGLKLVRY